MKTKLYKKYLKLVCASLGISKKQLFAKDFKECVIHCYKYNIAARDIERDKYHLMILDAEHPLSQMWDAFDMHVRWFLKYWRHSHWKPFIQMKMDLGIPEDNAVLDILDRK